MSGFMSIVRPMPRIFDNSANSELSTGITEALRSSERLDACVGYFNIRGWKTLSESVGLLKPLSGPKARVMVGMLDRPDQDALKQLRQIRPINENITYDGEAMAKALNGIVENLVEQIITGIPNNSDMETLVDLRDSLRDKSVIVKAYLAQRLHAKLYISHHLPKGQIPRTGFVGSSNLTLAGLEGQGELNIDVVDVDATKKLADWFDKKWNDLNAVDISEKLAQIIDDSWINQVEPYLVHLKFAYHLSREAREGNLVVKVPTDIEKDLLEFQKSAVRTATRILQHNRGVMIADVVGLGKTMTATAIARTLEDLENVETLIICPKNLVSMWQEHIRLYRLRGARVVSLSMVANELEELGRHRLVIIDESHNLRNSGGQRYNAVKNYVAKNDPRVVLLTATPYNVDLSDIADQLALFLPDDYQLPVRPDQKIQEVGGLAEFNRILKGANSNTLEAFRKSEFPEDWRSLLQYFLIRRTRGFVKSNYASKDSKGRYYLTFPNDPENKLYFPKRVPHVLTVTDNGEEENQVLAAVDLVAKLKLSRQGLGNYLSAEALKFDDQIVKDLKNQKATLQGLTRTNLVKRRSSSAAAYSISIQRHIIRDLSFVYALDNKLELPIGAGVDTDLSALKDQEIVEIANEHNVSGHQLLGISPQGKVGVISRDDATLLGEKAYERVKGKVSVRLRWVPLKYLKVAELRTDLLRDVDLMFEQLAELGVIDASRDAKIAMIYNELIGKRPNEKFLIFSEYQDTSEYLAAGLAHTYKVENLECVNGQSTNIERTVRAFSPKSNANLGGLPEGMNEIRVLVTTDVLSEGQNLQDASNIANFDLPWALIRLVQRAGRVDRLGQESDVVNVFVIDPSAEVNRQISLRQRLQKRLIEAGAIIGGDDKFFGSDLEAQEISELLTGNGLELDEGETLDVDPASYAFEIWRKAIEEDPSIQDRVVDLPLASRSTIKSQDLQHEGEVLALISLSNVQDSCVSVDQHQNFRMISQIKLLNLTNCKPTTSAKPPISTHLESLQIAADGAVGAFGTGSLALVGIRKALYDRLRAEPRLQNHNLFSDSDARVALQQVYERPLTEQAKTQFGSALKTDSNEQLIDRMVVLSKEGNLVIDGNSSYEIGLQFIASMGLKGAK